MNHGAIPILGNIQMLSSSMITHQKYPRLFSMAELATHFPCGSVLKPIPPKEALFLYSWVGFNTLLKFVCQHIHVLGLDS
jgi:hypothetical protein